MTRPALFFETNSRWVKAECDLDNVMLWTSPAWDLSAEGDCQSSQCAPFRSTTINNVLHNHGNYQNVVPACFKDSCESFIEISTEEAFTGQIKLQTSS